MLKPFFTQQIIGVEPGPIIAAAFLNALINRIVLAKVFFNLKIIDCRFIVLQLLLYQRIGLGVENQNLKLTSLCLCQLFYLFKVLEGLGDEPVLIVRRDYY